MPSTSPSARYVRRTVKTITQRPGAMSQLLRLGTPVALSAMLGAAPAMAASFIAADAWIADNDRSQVTSGASLETLGGTAVTFTSTPDNANFGSSMTSGELRGVLTCSTSICGASGLSGAFRSRTPVGGRNIEAITFTLDTPKVINGETVSYVVVAINNASAYATGNQVSYSANAGAIAGELDTALAALRGDVTDPLITGPSGGQGDATSAKTINEGSTTVATFSANEDVTWAIDSGADQARFTINPSTGLLSFTAAPDYESPNDLGDTANNNTYVVVIKATDLAGNVATQTVTVTVADLDDSLPIITGPDGDGTTTGPNANITLPEGGRTVTTFTASELVEWSISGTDAGRFSIDPATGALTFNAASDYENPLDDNADNVYTLVVSALDSDDNVTTQTLTVTITDVDDTAPVITGPNGNTGTTAGITINEGTTAVTTYASNDATATWSITGGADAALFSIDPDTGALTFINAPDYETPNDQGATAGNNTYVVRVAATDRRNNSDSQTLTVTIADLDEDGPVITGPDGDGTTTGENANITLDEGGTAVTAFTANEDVTWSISGTDADAFTIDPATGVLVFRARTDYEAPVDGDGNNVYVITVSARDAEGNVTRQTLTVTIADLDEDGPVITGPDGDGTTTGENANITLDEGGTAVTTFTANEDVTWSISGTDADAFTIDPATGVLVFRARTDYEAPVDGDGNNVYVITVSARDADGNVTRQTLTVTIADLDEDGPVITGPDGNGTTTGENANITLDEGGTAVTAFAANEDVTWSILGTDADAFTIDPATGVLVFRARTDYEAPVDGDGNNVYVITVSARDADGNVTRQ
ncbi:beta strand repeat-containing protein, partial [Gemmobacter lanyuensis]|uniref:beta strand repeat-containing protein n=1 Tax=Gemmobacter lanyuensis TaxID=1054497 RepID=UPI001671A935